MYPCIMFMQNLPIRLNWKTQRDSWSVSARPVQYGIDITADMAWIHLSGSISSSTNSNGTINPPFSSWVASDFSGASHSAANCPRVTGDHSPRRQRLLLHIVRSRLRLLRLLKPPGRKDEGLNTGSHPAWVACRIPEKELENNTKEKDVWAASVGPLLHSSVYWRATLRRANSALCY